MEIAMGSPESRRAARRAVDLSCEIIICRWDRPVRSRGTDLSPYGMWIETTVPLAVGEQVVVELSPPGRERALPLFARVMRIERDERDLVSGSIGVGLEFVNVTIWEQRILTGALRGLPPHLPGHKRDRRLAPS